MTSTERESSPRAFSELLDAATVRRRARMVYDAGRTGKLSHFDVRLDKLPTCARYVAETIRQNYPSLQVPPHARWRHLDANGRTWSDRLSPNLSDDPQERARQRIDLAVTSVLLDAGAGPGWRWSDPVTGGTFVRSEGLALASLEAFRSGLFSSDPSRPCMADAAGLADLSKDRLAAVFQIRSDNALVGLDGRVALLRRLGAAIQDSPAVFGTPARVGGIADYLRQVSKGPEQHGAIVAPQILSTLLYSLGSIWPGRIELAGINLGDTWRHPAVVVPGPTSGLIPFHKLSQWLSYSLIEPLQEAGISVTDLDGLTGLAEYRNGGLFIDSGVLVPRDPTLEKTPLTPDAEPIVEWRALTVALLDEIAPLVRKELGVSAEQMPLASILEGGTWSAGRRIAREKRADGGPPLTIISDGTVF